MLFLVLVSSTTPTPGRHILLVDDDASVRASVKLLLSIDRHQVTEAAGGREALNLFTGAKYDLVIIDYFMPDMLGDTLARNLRQLAPALPILMLTAYREKLVDYGPIADAVLGKPVSIAELRAAIANLIR